MSATSLALPQQPPLLVKRGDFRWRLDSGREVLFQLPLDMNDADMRELQQVVREFLPQAVTDARERSRRPQLVTPKRA